MNSERFQGELVRPSPGYLAARRAWLRYYVSAEEFDRTLPGMWHPRLGKDWLVAPQYVDRSRRNATVLWRAAEREAALGEATTTESEEARQDVFALSHESAKAELSHLDGGR